jgi:ABC-type Co2+ transport system permease subunit
MSCGALIGWLWYRTWPLNRSVSAFLAGFFGIALPAFLVSILFYLLNYGKGMIFLLTVYLPAAVIEGLLTTATIVFLHKSKPELLK